MFAYYSTADVNYQIIFFSFRYKDGYYYQNKKIISSRNVTCHDLEITEFNLPWFSLAVTCVGKFSVHSLVNDVATGI